MSQNQTPSSRFAGRISIAFLLWMVVFAVVTAGCGVTYAYFKNQQVAVKTEIDKLQRRITVCRMSANHYRAKINAQTNRWAMRSRLQAENSPLREITRDQIELARSERDLNRTAATASR